MSDYEYVFKVAEQESRRELTGRQRSVMAIARILADDMDTNGTVAELRTAALLRLVVDAIDRGYEGGLVEVGRKWRREMEAGGEQPVKPFRNRLTRAEVAAIKARLRDTSDSHRVIAADYGVCRETITKIANGDNWGHVEAGSDGG